jgi:hypothetical protein
MSKMRSDNELLILNKKIKYFDFGNINSPNSIYIQGQLHANEVNTFTTLYSLVEKLKNNPPLTRVRIVPCCNPFGWDIYLNGNDGRTSFPKKVDWNRMFTKTPVRDESMENELAYALWQLSIGFDTIIDVHSPDYGYPHVYTTDINYRLRTFDDLPYAISENIVDGSFQNLNIIERRITAFTFELPSYEVWTNISLKYWTERLFNEITAYSIDHVSLLAKPNYFGKLVSLTSKISGVPLLLLNPNEIANSNSEIVKIISNSGEYEILTFPNICIPICFRRKGIIESGRMVVKVLSLLN